MTEYASEWDPNSSSDSDWSEEKGKKRQQENKGKMKTRSSSVKEQTRTTSVRKRGATSKPCENASQSLEELMKNNSQLPVTCGNKEGSLYLDKFYKKGKCIFSEGQWFSLTEFEKFGGKEKSKKWKQSILCCGVPLQKLIESSASECSPITSRLRRMKRNSPKSSNAAKSSHAAGRARQTKCKKKRVSSNSESERRDNGHHGHNGNNNNEDEIDMTVFQGPTLPVTCGSVSGILHRSRFGAGHCGLCIRTEEFWLTPEDFIRLGKQDGTWRKDIVTHGIPLGELIMKRVFEPHALNCECDVCQELDQYRNDDVCYVCDSEEDLVCCDECPRAFHPHCHLPAVDSDSESQWSCTFCMMKKLKGCKQKTQQDILNSPLSQYRLHCQYLLLYLLHEITAEPCTKLSVNGNVKLNLQTNTYETVGEFVTDIEHIFQQCTSKGDDDLSRMEHMFKREFETIFKPL